MRLHCQFAIVSRPDNGRASEGGFTISGRSLTCAVRPARFLLIYLAAVFLGGALLAPALHALVASGAGQSPALQSLASKPFHRYVSRSILVIAVVGLWPLLRSLGIRHWRDAGLGSPSGQWGRVAGGFALGFGSLAVVAGVALAGGARHLDSAHSSGEFIKHLVNASLSAVVVAMLEELIFRGALFGGLRRAYGFATALAVSSSIYALVHFFERAVSPTVIDWAAGFVTLGSMLRGFTNVHALVPGFFNLALAGGILALAFYRSGTLYFSIGLHAGWILWLKTYGFLTQAAPGPASWLWGTSKMIDGWIALPVLAVVWLTVARLFTAEARRRGEKEKDKAFPADSR